MLIKTNHHFFLKSHATTTMALPAEAYTQIWHVMRVAYPRVQPPRGLQFGGRRQGRFGVVSTEAGVVSGVAERDPKRRARRPGRSKAARSAEPSPMVPLRAVAPKTSPPSVLPSQPFPFGAGARVAASVVPAPTPAPARLRPVRMCSFRHVIFIGKAASRHSAIQAKGS